jgi:nucleoside-diphosphate-sugar epimerase
MRWLTDDIATGSYTDVSKMTLDQDTVVFDVRDLVDKSGNTTEYINDKIDQAVSLLNNKKKLIVCCDYGMSRSNSVAAGIISKWKNILFSDAVALLKSKVDSSGIKIEMLNTVYQALNKNKKSEVLLSNILVLGGSGFIGKNLVSELSGVRNVYAPTSKEIDLRNSTLDLDLYVKSKNIGLIINLANPKIFTTNNSLGDSLIMLKNVLDVCRTNNVKIIYPSGWEIYSGYRSTGLLVNERFAANPKGTYGETKWLSEVLIRQYAAMYGLKYQIIRSGPLYGVGGEKPKFIYNFLEKARMNKEIQTHKYINGSPLLDLMYIDDYLNAIKIIAVSEFEGDVNLGTGVGTSTFDIASLICNLTTSASEIKQIAIDDYASNIIMDCSLAFQKFGWTATIDIKEGLKRIIKKQ